MDEGKRIERRHEDMKSKRVNFETKWQLIGDHCVGRGNFVTERTPGERRDHYIYDGTSMKSSKRLASAINAVSTNSATNWFEVEPEDPMLMENAEVARWFSEVVNRRMHKVFQNAAGGFSSQIHEMYLEYIDFGTGAIFIDDVPGRPIMFSSRPLGEIFIDEDPYGHVDTVSREFTFTAHQAWVKWGKNCGDVVMKQLEKDPARPFKFVHMVEPNEDYLPKVRHSMQVRSTVLSIEGKHICEEKGYNEMPYAIPRWMKRPGEVYGTGPGEDALPDQMMLNEMKRTGLKAKQKAVDPPLMVADDGTIVQLNTDPEGVIPVPYSMMIGGHPPIQPLVHQGRFDVGDREIELTQASVREAYHAELFRFFDDPRMTATQVIELSTKAQQMIGPTLTRLQTEGLEPILSRVFSLMLRRGDFGDVPDELTSVNIKYVSPAQRAQEASDAAAIDETVLTAVEWSQVDPTVLDNVDLDEAWRVKADSKGIPTEMVRSRKDVAMIRQSRIEAQMEQEQQAQALQAAEGLGKLAPVIAATDQRGAA